MLFLHHTRARRPQRYKLTVDGLDIALCRSKVELVQVSRPEIYHTPTYEVALCLSPRPGPFGLKPGGMDSFSFFFPPFLSGAIA